MMNATDASVAEQEPSLSWPGIQLYNSLDLHPLLDNHQ